MIAEAKFDGRRLNITDPRQYHRELMRMKLKPGQVAHIRISRPTRSERANAYYWSTVLEAIVDESESGNTAEDLHDAFCERFITTQRKQVEFFSKLTGEVITTSVDHRRSSGLSGMAFYDFVEQVRDFARTFWGIETPDPDPEYWRKPERKRKKAA
jgi:hypothetical protein